jgi:hypothetical protein
MHMPKPDPYFPSTMSSQKSYSPYQSLSSPASRQDGSSPHSSKRRLPQESGYANGVETFNKTQISPPDPSTSSITSNSSSYTSHANSSYSSIDTTVMFDGTTKSTKSPGSTSPMPPANNVAYSDEYNQTHHPSYNPYDQEVDLDYSQPQQDQATYLAASAAPVPPPLPPKIPYPSNPVSMGFYDDSTRLSPRECLCRRIEPELTSRSARSGLL